MVYEWDGLDAPPDFDQILADSYLGKYILVGVTYLDFLGQEVERIQMHGIVHKVSPDGIEIKLEGARKGEIWIMPPTLDAIYEAEPGTYKLHSTNEEVEDPDLVSTWSVTKPALN
ncbi:MAG TPA: hypothetical protein PLH13_04705 [Burkholderiaceae bacterium]|nr:hypothetical protein [Burkholderiaceae bacterium]